MRRLAVAQLQRTLGFEVLFGLALVTIVALLPAVLGTGITSVAIGLSIVLFFCFSWNLTGGVLGDLNLAHVVAWGIGGLGTVLLLQRGLPLAVAIPIVTVLGAAFAAGLILVSATLRLDGLYFAVFSLVVTEIAIALTGQIGWLGGNEGVRLPVDTRLPIQAYHWSGVLLVAASILVTQRLLSSPMGLRWLAIRDDPYAARAVGVSVLREKVVVYGLSGALAAVGGAFQAHYLGFASPATSLSIGLLVIAILAVFSGGPGTVLGPAVGALLIEGLASIVNFVATDPEVALAARFAQYVVAFLLIRLIISKAGGDDLITALFRRKAVPPSARPVPRQPADHVERVRGPASAAEAPTTLAVAGVAKAFGGNSVLADVSFRLRQGEFVALVGPNGAGKTTVTNLVTGFMQPDRGSITFLGTSIAELAPEERFAAGIVRTFQTPRLFPRLTLLQNTALACGGDADRAAEVLQRLDVTGLHQKAADSTLFEHRMVEVARALAAQAKLLLLDEPLAGLSPQQREIILAAVAEEVRHKTSVLIIEHLIPTIAPVVDRMVVLVGGSIVAEGLPRDVLTDPTVVSSYLGQPVGPAA